jgi:hypothetical protein
MPKCLALLSSFLIAAPPAGFAAESEPQPLDELDEIVISNARLGDRILALENTFYQRYNELNEDDQYDMYCTQIPVRRGDPEMTRACLPMFYVDALGDSLNWQYRCQSTRACYTPPDPTAVLFARNQQLRNHMKGVIDSDPRLKEMNDIRIELEMRLRAAAAAEAQMKRDAVDENGETREQRAERLRCARPGPARTNNRPCSPAQELPPD